MDQAIAIDRQDSDLKPKRLQILKSVQHGGVLGCAGDQMCAAPGTLERQGSPLDRQIVGLGAAAGKDQLFWAGPQHRRNYVARLIEGVERLATNPVDAGRIPKTLA